MVLVLFSQKISVYKGEPTDRHYKGDVPKTETTNCNDNPGQKITKAKSYNLWGPPTKLKDVRT